MNEFYNKPQFTVNNIEKQENDQERNYLKEII